MSRQATRPPWWNEARMLVNTYSSSGGFVKPLVDALRTTMLQFDASQDALSEVMGELTEARDELARLQEGIDGGTGEEGGG